MSLQNCKTKKFRISPIAFNRHFFFFGGET
jgi:hypothetical protein